MLKMKHSVRKYIVSTAIVTAFVFSPMLTGSVFAYGGPDTEAGQNNATNAPIIEQVDKNETTTVNTGVVSKGDRGETVRNVQSSLNNLGYSANPDGIFGPETDEAVRDFQEDNALAVDGMAGPATMEALSLTETTKVNETTEAIQDESLTISEAPNQQTKSATTQASQSDVVSIANSLVGSPYTPGGTTPAGFDSSGFINYVFAEVGIPLDRTHASMWANNGVHVDSPSVGDVVFFENTYKNGVSHSGIYLGNNQMIHAGTEETGVEITTMSYDYWQSRYVGAKSFN